MPVSTRVREHFALMSRALVTVGGLGGIGGTIGGIQLAQGVHGQGPWVWFAAGLGLLFVSQIWAVQRAITERNAARTNARVITQKAIQMDVGASIHGSSISNLYMSTESDAASVLARRPRRRLWPRVLEEGERVDLADRCAACSKEMLEWLHRPEPPWHTRGDWEKNNLAHDAHRNETEREFNLRYVARARDLLNECAEAGYSLDATLESVRLHEGFDGEIRWHSRREVAEGLGVVGFRVRRRSKRL